MSAAPVSIEMTLITLVIAGVVGFGLFVLISEKGKALFPDDYGRKWLAWAVFASTLAALRKFFLFWDLNSFAVWLLALVVFGGIAYILGLIIGRLIRYGEKPNVSSLGPRLNVADPKNNMDNEGDNSAPHYKHAPKSLSDDALYEMAWKETEKNKGDRGLWAKAYAICDGEMEKTRAYYIRERVKFLQQIQKKRLDAYKIKSEGGLVISHSDGSLSGKQDIEGTEAYFTTKKDRRSQKSNQKSLKLVMWIGLIAVALVAVWQVSKSAYPINPQAQNDLAYKYYFGTEVRKDYFEAAKWFRKAAKGGMPGAYRRLGDIYSIGGDGIQKDDAVAVRFWQMEVDQGHNKGAIAATYYELGVSYYEGRGVRKDYVEAVKWFRKAAVHKNGILNAAGYLGVCYHEGQGVRKDYVESVKWLRKAAGNAEHGLSDAQYLLGMSYYNGHGVRKNHDEAAHWWRMASDKGSQEASSALEKLIR